MQSFEDTAAIWVWPWTIVQTQIAMFEILADVPSVLAARLPMISDAMNGALTTNTTELTRMVTERAEAHGRLHRSFSSAARKVQMAAVGNARDLGKITGGGILWPSDYMRMAERNLGALAELATFPRDTMVPIRNRVTSNVRRLKAK